MAAPKYALDVVLPPQPDKIQAVHDLIASGPSIVAAEPDTLHWYGYKTLEKPDGTPSFFGIFDTFPSEAGRDAHVGGELAKVLTANADTLLSGAPQIVPVTVLGHTSLATGTPKIGVRALFTMKAEAEEEIKGYLKEGEKLISEEPQTLYWFAFQKSATTFGVFVLFETEEGRAAHASSPAATAFGEKAANLFDGPVDVTPFEVVALK
ncbi:hypothetical protein BV25DRAFT_623740 [Artomyces pyxidatus]|uniref:Uncharacterized protein n=1 Tax=Artomyces pyxidatus TaxID=48021 RepID=A0ACB8T3U4_9AGAM|nr:hypothetical protein BV25DRAFT_623740 [Artomyces pyxidatus]